jgi:hypothetical protein
MILSDLVALENKYMKQLTEVTKMKVTSTSRKKPKQQLSLPTKLQTKRWWRLSNLS